MPGKPGCVAEQVHRPDDQRAARSEEEKCGFCRPDRRATPEVSSVAAPAAEGRCLQSSVLC